MNFSLELFNSFILKKIFTYVKISIYQHIERGKFMNRLTVHTNEKTDALGDLYGIFFEDLNHAADGGLYAEMVRNRGFEFSPIDNPGYRALTAWKKIERAGAKLSLAVEKSAPLSVKNPHYLMMEIYQTGNGSGISNEGYNSGMPYIEGEKYIFSCYARADEKMVMNVALEDVDGNIYTQDEFIINNSQWSKYELTLTATKTDYCGRLVITAKNTGKLYLDMISLFPEKTFKGHGLRLDLAQLLADLKPKFMRFPGGCLIHDGSLNKDDRNALYRWKNTIGSLQDRASRRNNWGYNQSLGLGYYEYFVLCEDLGAKPIPILPAGYNPHSGQGVAYGDLQEWIDDALDLIEFANGSVETEWGSVRARLGHPQPFNMEYIGIGNEEIGQEFFDRYEYFHKAIREKYPEIKIINSSGPFCSGTEYERGWNSARENGSDLVDEHYYTSPEWFLANCHRYDDFSKDGPKVFLGEYATWGNTYYNALAEAAYMTHLERNAAVVGLACYAPLFANVDYVNWKPDMIWFDNHRSYGSANYYIQKMFMNNQGTSLLKTESEGFTKTTVLGKPIISGEIMLEAESGVKAEFTDISVLSDGKTRKYDDISVESASVHLDNVESENYVISLKAKRISGDKGFRIKFGKTDDKNFLDWTLGGWANGDCEIESNINGRTSGIIHKVFSVATGVIYDLKLEVQGRNITIYINGEKQYTVEDKQPVVEELYWTSSIDEATGEIIIKAVNVREEAVKAVIDLDGKCDVSGKVIEISGCQLDAENSFENPKAVYPAEREFSANAQFDYEFPAHSVTVFVLK